jgi:regulatory protein
MKMQRKVSKKPYKLRTDLQKARASALASLVMREHSIKELEDKLTRKDYQQDSIEIVIAECLKDNYLNDRRFAEIFWRSRSRKGFGSKKIMMELKQKGIKTSLAIETSEQEELDFEQVIQAIYLKKFKGTEIKDFKDKLKRQNYLYQRGFDLDLIRTVIPL